MPAGGLFIEDVNGASAPSRLCIDLIQWFYPLVIFRDVQPAI